MVQNKKIILASKSPRRQSLLKELNVEFEIRLKEVDEIYPENLRGGEVPVFLSKLKGETFKNELKEDEVIVTADTIVWLNDSILGKPLDRNDAIAILKALSGNMHRVITGVTIQQKDSAYTFSESTEVYFKKLSEGEITYYIDTFKPFDKAGAYGIQEWIGYVGVERINGCFYNVMGLPLFRLHEEFLRLGIVSL
ncbi:MAG: Maf family nucleotide pyrophosphatase [Flavobacteriales bacterium]